MKRIILIAAALLMTACAEVGFKGETGPAGIPGVSPTPEPPPIVTSPSPMELDIAMLLEEENAYRLGLGQTMLSAGLSCTVIKVVSGQWLSSSSPGYNAGQGVISTTGQTSYTYLYKGWFNQEDANAGSTNLLPDALKPMVLGVNHLIRCTGSIVVSTTGWYNFETNSDDGSIVYVNGSAVVVNDGNHAMTLKSGSRYLRRGVHTFRVDYAQTGGGNYGMILKANGSLINPAVYAH